MYSSFKIALILEKWGKHNKTLDFSPNNIFSFNMFLLS